MTVLAIDSARSEGGVALVRNGTVASSASLGRAPGFSESLFGTVADLLAGQGLTLGDMDGFAAATGPGSFTGIRVGLVAAKALAEAHRLPLVGVSSLQALASAAPGENARVAVLDARRGEVFAGFYDHQSNPLSPETIGVHSDLAPGVSDMDALVVANEPGLFEPEGALAAGAEWARHLGPPDLAREVGLLAAREIESGRGCLPETVEANYIRRPGAVPPAVAGMVSR